MEGRPGFLLTVSRGRSLLALGKDPQNLSVLQNRNPVPLEKLPVPLPPRSTQLALYSVSKSLTDPDRTSKNL